MKIIIAILIAATVSACALSPDRGPLPAGGLSSNVFPAGPDYKGK